MCGKKSTWRGQRLSLRPSSRYFIFLLSAQLLLTLFFPLDAPSEGVRLVREKLGEAPVDIGEDIPFVAPDIDVPLSAVVESRNGEEVTLSCTVKPCLPHPSFAFYHNDQIIHPGEHLPDLKIR